MVIFNDRQNKDASSYVGCNYDPEPYFDVVGKSVLHDHLKSGELMVKMEYLADMAVNLPNLDETIDILYSGDLNLAELIQPLLTQYKSVVDEMKETIPDLAEMSDKEKIAAITNQYSSWGQFYSAILTEFCLNHHPIQECLQRITNIQMDVSPSQKEEQKEKVKIEAKGSFTSSINNLLVKIIKSSCAEVDDIYIYDSFRLLATNVGLFTSVSHAIAHEGKPEDAKQYLVTSRLDLNETVNTWLPNTFNVKPFYQSIYSIDALVFLLATDFVSREMIDHSDPDLERCIRVINSNPETGAPFQIMFQNYFLSLDTLKDAPNSIESRLIKYLTDNYGGTFSISSDVCEDKLTYTNHISEEKGITHEQGHFVGTIVKFCTDLYKPDQSAISVSTNAEENTD